MIISLLLIGRSARVLINCSLCHPPPSDPWAPTRPPLRTRPGGYGGEDLGTQAALVAPMLADLHIDRCGPGSPPRHPGRFILLSNRSQLLRLSKEAMALTSMQAHTLTSHGCTRIHKHTHITRDAHTSMDTHHMDAYTSTDTLISHGMHTHPWTHVHRVHTHIPAQGRLPGTPPLPPFSWRVSGSLQGLPLQSCRGPGQTGRRWLPSRLPRPALMALFLFVCSFPWGLGVGRGLESLLAPPWVCLCLGPCVSLSWGRDVCVLGLPRDGPGWLAMCCSSCRPPRGSGPRAGGPPPGSGGRTWGPSRCWEAPPMASPTPARAGQVTQCRPQ